MKKMRAEDIDRIVSEIDDTRVAEHWRSPDRPDGRFVVDRRRQDPAIGRAKARLRTASYRNCLDRRGAPSTAQIGMALVVAMVTSSVDVLTAAERGILASALIDLQARGFSVVEAKAMLLRLRDRISVNK